METRSVALIMAILAMNLLSSLHYDVAPLHGAEPSMVVQQDMSQYVTLLPALPSSNPSPWIVVPTSSTIWVASVPRNGLASLSQIREYWINGTTKTGLNLTNVILSGMIADPSKPSDKIWFTENSTLATYQLGQTAAVKRVTLPGQNLEYLSFDSQDRIWMSTIDQSGTSNIVMFNPSDNSTYPYQVPGNNTGIQGVSVAHDNSIWFAEAGARRIGHLVPGSSPVWSEFSPPSWVTLSAPIQVSLDSQGKVWFTDHGTNQFGVLDPLTSNWKVYPIGYCVNYCVDGLPNAIFVDSNNIVWISEHIAGRVGRFDPSTGTLTEYNVSPGNFPLMWWAMPGPDDLVWFVANNLGTIGYVNASIPVAVSVQSSSKSITLQRGGSTNIPVKVSTGAPSVISFGIAPVAQDQPIQFPPLIYGSSPSNLTLTSNSQTVTFSLSTAWNATLGPRYVALTATIGQVEVSIHILVTVVEAAAPYLTLGLSSIIIAGGAALYLRRPRKKRLAATK